MRIAIRSAIVASFIGLSTFLAQLVLKQPLSRVNTQEFAIDGTWSDPKVTKVTAHNATP